MKKNKGRNFNAIAAQFRNSAGPEKVKRKYDDKFVCREFKKKWRDSILEIEKETEEDESKLYDSYDDCNYDDVCDYFFYNKKKFDHESYAMELLALDEELDN